MVKKSTIRMQQVQAPIIPIIGEMIRNHPGTISLGQGVVNYAPPSEVHESISRFFHQQNNHKYQPVQGIPELYETLREKLLRENDLPVVSFQSQEKGSCLCVTAGGNMAFVNTVLAIADPGDEIILLKPYYFNHEMAVRLAACTPILVDTDALYQIDLDALQAAMTPRTRAVLTVSPNNPSGAVYPQETLRAVNRLCQDRGIYHISDEAYEYFTYDTTAHFSPGSIEGAGDHTVSLFSLSKAYGFASWRIGYMVYPQHLNDSIKKIQDTILICPPVISQYAALGALQAGRKFFDEKFQEIRDVRRIVLDALQPLRDICTIPETQGAFYFLIQISGDFDDMMITERLVKEHGVAVIPGQAFGMKYGCYLRISYGSLPKNTAAEGIERLVIGVRRITGV